MSIIVMKQREPFICAASESSYLMTVLKNGQLGQLYFGKRIHHREDFSYLLEYAARPMASCVFEEDKAFSMEHLKQEYAVYGTSDYRSPAAEVLQENGSRVSQFCFRGYRIMKGKPKLEGLPAVYTESLEEAETLIVELEDQVDRLAAGTVLYDFRGRGHSDQERQIYQSRRENPCI